MDQGDGGRARNLEHRLTYDDLRDWIAETANSKRSESHRFNDESVNSAKHPIFETSFGI